MSPFLLCRLFFDKTIKETENSFHIFSVITQVNTEEAYSDYIVSDKTNRGDDSGTFLQIVRHMFNDTTIKINRITTLVKSTNNSG